MKKHAAQLLTLFAKTYLVIVLLAAGWALYTDLTLLSSQREHLAPDILLLIVTLPSSSSLTYLCDALPGFFSGPIVQVGWVTLCGIGQAWLLVALTRVSKIAIGGHHHQ
jgi:hypothetical protein